MNEFIEVRFRKPGGTRLKVKRQLPGGIEFDETDPSSARSASPSAGASEVTKFRMRHIAQVKGWELGQFKLNISVEDGSLILRGDDQDALPEGHYKLRVEDGGDRDEAGARPPWTCPMTATRSSTSRCTTCARRGCGRHQRRR